MRKLLAGTGGGADFWRSIFAPVAAVTLIVTCLSAFGLQWSANQADKASVDRQVRETRNVIDRSLDELAHQQEAVAVWDQLVTELNRPAPDLKWLDENVGVWLFRMYRHDRVYILGGDDRARYAVVDGTRRAPAAYDAVATAVRPLVDATRGRTSERSGMHERLPGHALHVHNLLATGPRAVHATRLVAIGGRPATVSVMRIVPLVPDAVPGGGRNLLVSIRFLDGAFLRDLSERHMIAGLHYARAPATAPGERALALEAENGRHIGYLLWRPELPGTSLFHTIAPVTAIGTAVMILLMAMLAGFLHRAMRAQERAKRKLEATVLELQASEAQAQHLAFHDVLTGLPNRALFNERAEAALLRARRGEAAAVLLLDLDRFKNVNDTLGHQAGDALIREFGARVSALLGEDDMVARLGGDEFAILKVSPGGAEGIEALCRQILNVVRLPFDALGNHAYVGVSIGVATTDAGGFDRVDLMRKADIALYRAKGEGRDCYRLFTEAMDATIKLRGVIEEDLRQTLETGEGLRLFYQPQVDSDGITVIGLEALVRWEHPTRGLISPEQFVPVAEEAGLIGQLGDWVLREACAASVRWPDLYMAVNLSPVQFRTPGLAARVEAIVRECGADPARIELEVTESVLLDDDDQVRDALAELRAAGFRIALDDFGTGYSSLSYLRRFEVDKIKIDRSFVQHLGHTHESASIITAVVTLGHAMGLSVTAEGVETADQRSFLSAAGCNSMQGFLFSRAVPEDALAALLAEQEAARHAA